jgi:3-phenylpropionate/trans-cinnamate dioxygenase ferredoxin reductase subunit
VSDRPAPPRVVIVGASTAGRSAAVALREAGHDGEVILVGEEPHPPYDRPQLSKEYLRGDAALDDVIRPLRLTPEHAIESRFGVRVRRVLPDKRRVELEDGERIGYDRLLLATGVRNRRLRVPGADLEGVLDLRDVAGSDRIRAAAGPGCRAVVVGMGFIGCEVAAALRHLGADVTAVEPLAVPLERSLGETAGRVVEGLHRDHGVDLRLGEGVAAFEGAGRVERVVTSSGAAIDCDLVVAGVGVEPAVETVAGTAVALDDGVVVDERCRSSVPGILAAGDVARHLHPVAGRHIRVEHWQNAVRQGQVAARSLLGAGDAVHDDVPWFWSDQYDCNIQYAGFAEPWDRLVVRGSLEERRFIAFQLRETRIVAAVAFNQGRDLRRATPLIRAGVAVDPERLADPGVDLRGLAATERPPA